MDADGTPVDIREAERRPRGGSQKADMFETSMRRAKTLLSALDGGPLILDPGAFPIVVAELDRLSLQHGKDVSQHEHDDDDGSS